ncbi:protease inhibitor Inh/omp19 family protein [Pseudomonas chlororaphis]|uniref:AprI/Inh family metalloprotease inhibitor n=1 Tax=Pseudomonas chlororaphis TaxID=587753 RepID=UPI001E418042|nr:AprI/Inh family metalloprotease inhibitor [Pseudomonas chlororaphis]MCB2255115.1 protease inhibitor Inh/omp19 family protein [Pseudomonas chlororaphis]
MIRTAFIAKAGAYLIATLMMFSGETSMASSLRLADPAELAGHWQLSQPAEPASQCVLDLERNGTLGAGAECLSGWLGDPAIGWFPEPDGIAVTGKEGSKIIFLSRQKDGLYEGTLKSGAKVILQRTP